jgi:hypothetical protein
MSISRNLSDTASRLWWEEVEAAAAKVKETGRGRGAAVKARHSIGFVTKSRKDSRRRNTARDKS